MAVRLCKSQIRGLITHNAIAETPLVPKGRQPLGRGVNPCSMDTWREVASERRHSTPFQKNCINGTFLIRTENFRRKLNTFVNASVHEATMLSEDDGAEGTGQRHCEKAMLYALFLTI